MSSGAASQGQPGPTPAPDLRLLLRPEHVPNLAHLNDERKQQYSQGLKKLWTVIDSNPPESQAHREAVHRLATMTQRVKADVRSYKEANQAQTQAQAQQQAQAQAQTQNQAPAQNQAQGQGQPHAQGQALGQSQIQDPSQPPTTQANQQAGPAQPQAQAQGPQVNVQDGQSQLQRLIETRLRGLLPPAHIVDTRSEEALRWFAEARNKYGARLKEREIVKSKLNQTRHAVEVAKSRGQEPPQEMLNQQRVLEQQYQQCVNFIEQFERQQAQTREERKQQQQQQQSGGQQQGGNMPGTGARPQQQIQQQQRSAPLQPQAPQSHNLNSALEAARVQANLAAGHPSMSPVNAVALASHVNQVNGTSASSHNQQQQAQANFSVSRAQSRPPHQIPQQPSVTVQQSIPQQQGQHNFGGGGPPQPLSQNAAVNAANAANAANIDQRATPPSSIGNQPHMPMARDQPGTNPKFPIPKVLNVETPRPVNMGPGRPTMGGPATGAPGAMGQPAIHRQPHFVLEGEGERVLSKKKLSELVRQVTGGYEGNGEKMVTDEVEEAMLQCADEFVDNVVTAACRVAKIRNSTQLEIRDLQLILERNYNIRIPGYASDEIRTVRRPQPAPGWTQKMNAIQAAKVMGGKGDT